ncbi:flavin-containing monooxygenase [Microbacterium suwonense]|uniref:Monooxygenase n=2 Tax=Microbacterium suwonense TaxID=683047 RepID=A0ABM8FUB7_9MICO|nr:monooxygenase [Microbacterium suwonense]
MPGAARPTAELPAPLRVPFDDLFWRDEYDPIVETDAELAAIVERADLPALLAALAAALGDPSILEPGLRPPLTLVDTFGHPHGGMTSAQVERGREVALAALVRLRDSGIRSVGILPREQVDAILDFLTNGRAEYWPSLKHELGLAPDKNGAPDFVYADLAGSREFRTLVIGAGVSGIAAGYRLMQAGAPFTIIDEAPALGGTWWKNRYPGVRLDTPTFGYSYSFAQKTDWPHQFAEGGEIHDYLAEVADRAGITERIEFGTRFDSARWDEDASEWVVVLSGPQGTEERRFDAVISALGQLDRPHIPDFPGLETFAGRAVHSQDWDETVDVEGKRVVVIGTGASAYQIVPAVYEQVDHLTVFQRSAPWMIPADNYHERMTDTFDWLQRTVPHYGQWFRLWTLLLGIPGRFHTVTAEEGWSGVPLSVSAKNHEVRESLIARMAEQYRDRPDLLELAIPNYPPGAKRMLRDNGVWAKALQAPQTTVVSTGVGRITAEGVVDGAGVLHEADVIVFATGFKASDFLDGTDVVGRGGVELHDYWAGDSRAYNGITVPRFPNFFLIYGPNVNGVVAGSGHLMIERAAEYAVSAIGELLRRGARSLEVTEDALDRFVSWVDAGNRRMAWGQEYISNWYQNAAGRVVTIWPYTNVEYWAATESIAEEDYTFD